MSTHGGYLYCVCGLTLQSEIELPGLLEAQAVQSADAILRHGNVPLSLDGTGAKGPTWEMAGEDFLLRIPGIARFLVSGGREIIVEAEPGADFAAFASGAALAILLQQREHIVTNASAVRVNGKAVLFAGFSGAGKSVLAAAMDARGYSLCADDICIIDDNLTVHTDARHPQLWEFAIDKFDVTQRREGAVRNVIRKYHIAPNDIAPEALPLGAIYILREARAPHRPGIAPVEAGEAPLLMRRMAYHPRLLEYMGGHEHYNNMGMRLVGDSKLFHLTRRLDFALMDEVSGWLEQHWRNAP